MTTKSMETTEEIVWRLLKAVIDPELGCNIVDLGLVYAVDIADAVATVTMTLTTPGCPMHQSIGDGVTRMLSTIDGIRDVQVKIVWEPPWQVSMMSDDAKKQLGVY